MKKPGLFLLWIGVLIMIIGVMIYLTLNLPKAPANAKLVLNSSFYNQRTESK